MSYTSRKPIVLFIKGVFKKDCCTDEFFETKLIEKIDYNDEISTIPQQHLFVQIPQFFESIDKWPKKTNLCCWRCSLNFDTIPIFIPSVIEPIVNRNSENKYSISVYGVFCSFIDATAFVKESNWTWIEKVEAINKIKHLYRIFYGKNMPDYSNFPNVFSMVQYGGTVEVHDFKKLIENSKQFYELRPEENTTF